MRDRDPGRLATGRVVGRQRSAASPVRALARRGHGAIGCNADMRHTRPEVIARTRREFARLDRVVRRLGAADWKRRVPRPPTRDPWTVKDALCHILYWKEHTARVIRGERRLPEMRRLAIEAYN